MPLIGNRTQKEIVYKKIKKKDLSLYKIKEDELDEINKKIVIIL